MFLKKNFTKNFCSPTKKFHQKNFFCTKFFSLKIKNWNCDKILTRIVTKLKNSNSDNSISDKTLRQFFLAKNNLTPQQPMRGTLGIVLRFHGVFFCSMITFSGYSTWPLIQEITIMPYPYISPFSAIAWLWTMKCLLWDLWTKVQCWGSLNMTHLYVSLFL